MAEYVKSPPLTPELYDYIVAHGTPPDDVQRWLIEETHTKVGDFSMMQIAPDQGAFMTLVTRLVRTEQAVEVGTFTGYSALCIARGLEPGGRLLCCDVSEEWTAIALDAWKRAGVDDRIVLKIAPAIETLQALPEEEHLDLAFVDADKTSYAAYYEEILRRLRPNGLIMVDNTLWGGGVIDESRTDDDTKAIRAFNDMVAADDRVDTALTPIGDGLTLLRKR
jgi:caffeoyl-CoA O-methyltransferase